MPPVCPALPATAAAAALRVRRLTSFGPRLHNVAIVENGQHGSGGRGRHAGWELERRAGRREARASVVAG
eukprot:359108-Chlamydomonas_euryale.AAC.17